MAITALDGNCRDRATPELMELTVCLGSMVPYRKAAELLAEFLPIEPTEGHVTVRKRTLKVGSRLEEQSQRQERINPPIACERKQLELTSPDDPLHEFVVSVDTAHVRGNDPEAAGISKPDFGNGLPSVNRHGIRALTQTRCRRVGYSSVFEGERGAADVFPRVLPVGLVIYGISLEAGRMLISARPRPRGRCLSRLRVGFDLRP
jgi:hypothetical protein